MDTEYRMYHVAKLHYIDGLKQNEIAKMLNLSTMLVSRLLKKAEQEQIVTIHVRALGNQDLEAARLLRKRYPYLKEAIVVKVDEAVDTRKQIGQAAAQYLGDLVHDDMIIGLSWGKTLQEMAQSLSPTACQGVQVLQLSGGFLMGSDYLMMPSNLVKLASERLHSDAVFLNAPMFVASEEMCSMLVQEPAIHHALALSRESKINVMGVSCLNVSSTMSKVAIINQEDIDELRSLGAIGDVMGEFIDKNGEFVEWSKRRRCIGATVSNLSPDAYNICVAGELEKALIVDLSVRKRYVNTLVVSSALAREILKISK